jgi:hypothetical protein
MRSVVRRCALAVLLVVAVAASVRGQSPTTDNLLAADRPWRDARLHGTNAPVADELFVEVGPDGAFSAKDQPPFQILSFGNFYGRVYGDVGIIMGVARVVLSDAHFMRVWVHTADQWHIVASQFTPLTAHNSQPQIRVLDAGPVGPDDAEAVSVQDVERARLDALSHGDHAAYERLLGSDYASIDSTGLYMTKGADVGSRLTYDTRVAYDVTIRVLGPVAIVTGLESLVLKDGKQTGVMPFTRVWVRRGDSYECVAQQSTVNHLHDPAPGSPVTIGRTPGT